MNSETADAFGDGIHLPPTPTLPVDGRSEPFPVGRIWCVGRNYAAHAREMDAEAPPAPPFFFLKPASALVPPGGTVRYPPETGELHHEVELVVALGRSGWNVPPDEAEHLVFAYGVGLDLTRRDAQARAKRDGKPWALAKGFDGSAPCSALAPTARIGHPCRGRIELSVGGEVRQQGDLSDQVWPVSDVLAHLSRIVELQPGDLLFTGTPAGVGPLRPGDRVEAAIEGVGRLAVRISPPR
ncbi:MAG: fumarylacetoacetate hydrolase family protein [Gemmatimonadota bacterium]|nr:fumarylacetoacetate hydrolase family protein [Gemmatimonadota bacterium]